MEFKQGTQVARISTEMIEKLIGVVDYTEHGIKIPPGKRERILMPDHVDVGIVMRPADHDNGYAVRYFEKGYIARRLKTPSVSETTFIWNLIEIIPGDLFWRDRITISSWVAHIKANI